MVETVAAARVWSRERLPARVRLLLTSDAITSVGLGLTQPYLLVLLHTPYGLSVAAASVTASLAAVVSLVGNPLSGVLTDRYGGRRTMLGGLASVLAGLLTVGSGGSAPAAAVGVALTAFGWSLILPAFATLIADGVSEATRSRVFTLQYALFNAGMGVGAAADGLLVVDDRRLADLPLLWFVAAVTCVASGLLVSSLGRPGAVRAEAVSHVDGWSGYRRVLADRALWRVWTVAIGLSAAGYGVYFVGPAVVALAVDDPGALSWVATINCAAVVLGLPLALRVGRRLSPYGALRATAVVWAAAWCLCLAQVSGFGPGVRITLPVAAALIGVGELLLASALPTLVNALAPDALRGRYNALLTFAMTLGVWTGPLLASVTSYLSQGSLLFVGALAMLALVVGLTRRRVAS
jgi:MFS family permease